MIAGCAPKGMDTGAKGTGHIQITQGRCESGPAAGIAAAGNIVFVLLRHSGLLLGRKSSLISKLRLDELCLQFSFALGIGKILLRKGVISFCQLQQQRIGLGTLDLQSFFQLRKVGPAPVPALPVPLPAQDGRL